MKAVINGKIYTMDGAVTENGTVVFDDKIRYVGTDAPPEGCEIFDARGMAVTPGLIDAHCHVGIIEDSLGFEGDDTNEDTDPVTPHLRAIDGINPLDRAFEAARRAGVTAVVTGPGSANAIGGQFAAVKTAGVYIDDMIIKAPCAMKFALGENPKSVYGDKSEAPATRMGTMALIREQLLKASEYMTKLDLYNSDPDEYDKPDFDMKCASLIPVLRREIPVKVHAHRPDDIASAIRLKKEFNIDITLEHCTGGEVLTDIIKRENIPVMLGPTLTDRSKPELHDLSFSIYRTFAEAGISAAIITDHPEITIDRLPLCAAIAVKEGMDEMSALAGITSAAADNCRISDRVGRLRPGLDADIAVFSELPTRFMSAAEAVFINGERVK